MPVPRPAPRPRRHVSRSIAPAYPMEVPAGGPEAPSRPRLKTASMAQCRALAAAFSRYPSDVSSSMTGVAPASARRLRHLGGDLPDVAVGVLEVGGPHAPGAILRAVERRDALPGELGAPRRRPRRG